jgi:hypothetical protein
MGSVNFTLNDDGTCTATLQTVDKDNNPIPFPGGASTPVWSASDPSLTVTPASDGMTATITSNGTLLASATVTATSTLADGVTTISGSGTLSVVADANAPGSFTMSFA